MDEHAPKKEDSHSTDWYPFSHIFQERPFRNILETIDQLFQNSTLKPGFKVNVQEDDDQYIIYAELPGVNKNQIDINIMQKSVTITVKQTELASYKDDVTNTYSKTRSFEKQSRTIPLYHQINIKKAKAKYQDGLLTIFLPKKSGIQLKLDD